MIQFCRLRNGLSLVEMIFLSKNVSKSFICGIFCGISRLERARGALMQTMAERNGNDTDEARGDGRARGRERERGRSQIISDKVDRLRQDKDATRRHYCGFLKPLDRWRRELEKRSERSGTSRESFRDHVFRR